jgi:hypothetical protein
MSGFEDDFIPSTSPVQKDSGTNAIHDKTPLSDEDAAARREADIEPVKKWEVFDDPPLDEGDPSLLQSGGKEYTALGDDHHQLLSDDDEDDDLDGKPNPFERRAISMRPTIGQAISIVSKLQRGRTRSMSNGSLDREKTGRRPNSEDQPIDILRRRKQWELYLKQDRRVPGTRTYWLPVTVTLQDGLLSYVESTATQHAISPVLGEKEKSAPLGKLFLQHSNTITRPMIRYHDRSKRSKLHQVKIQQTTFREKRTLKRFFFVEHVSKYETLLKFGSHDMAIIDSFIEGIQTAVHELPVTRQPSTAYQMNEVFIDIKDNSDILMNCNGAVLDRQSVNKFIMQAFLTGTPECKLLVNDMESTLRSTSQGVQPLSMSQQVRLTDVVLHPCVDSEGWGKKREIVFHPIDACAFELLRCTVKPMVSPPVTMSAMMEYSEVAHTVRITASFNVKKKLNLTLRPITEMVIKFPVPKAWHPLLQAIRFGRSKSVRSTSGIRGSFRRKIKNENSSIEVHIGSAKFEKAHNAIMWRIGTYHSTSLPHRLEATIRLEKEMEPPNVMAHNAEVWYRIPGNSTGLSVRALKVATQDPNKWVKYEILYHYVVQMFPDLSVD